MMLADESSVGILLFPRDARKDLRSGRRRDSVYMRISGSQCT